VCLYSPLQHGKEPPPREEGSIRLQLGALVPEDILRPVSRRMYSSLTGFLESSPLRVNVTRKKFTVGIARMGLLRAEEIGLVLFAGYGLIAPLAN